MKNEIFGNKTKLRYMLKWFMCFLIFVYVVKFPDLIAHKIVWLVHTFYEGTSFLLEEFLRHTFGFDKFLAQLIVFYLSIVVGIGATVLLWRHVVRILQSVKGYLAIKLYGIKYALIYYWHSKWTGQKIKLILIHFALFTSAFMFLLT